MVVAIYVHLQPGVPAEVLPLGIKPAIIPLFAVVLDVMVAVPAWQDIQELPRERGHDSVVACKSVHRSR